MKQQYVLASSKVWIPDLAGRLEKKLGVSFAMLEKKDELTLEKLRSLNPKKIFFSHWSHLIPKEIYSEFECVIFHMTDLPFGRGGSPLQNLISRGIKVTRISALRCEEGLDTGPIYLKSDDFDISRGSAEEIFRRVNLEIEKIIAQIVVTNPEPRPQEGKEVLFMRRKPNESRLPENKSLEELHDFIRMLDAPGYPHAFIEFGDYRLSFAASELGNDGIKAEVVISKIKK